MAPNRRAGEDPRPYKKRDITGARARQFHHETKRYTLLYSAQINCPTHKLHGVKYWGLSDRMGLSFEEVMNRRKDEHIRQAKYQGQHAKGVHHYLWKEVPFIWKIEATCPENHESHTAGT